MRILAGFLSCLLSLCAFAVPVTATWDHDGRNVDGFRLSYQCQSKMGSVPAVATSRSLSFDAPLGESCTASMVAYNSHGESAPSNTAAFVPGASAQAPGAVTNLRVLWQQSSEPDRMSLAFDGTDDKASVGIATGSSPPITMATWAKLGNITNNAGGDVLMELGQNNFVNHHHRLQVGNGTVACAVAHTRSTVGGATQESQTTQHVTDTTTWHHFGGVWYTTTSRYAFLDGNQGPESTADTTLNTALLNTVQLGLRTDNNQDYQGKLAHSAIWIGVGLSPTEMAELAAGANPLDYYPENLWGYWPGTLINISGTDYLEDVSGNGRHMTITSATYDADQPSVAPPSGGTAVDAGLEGLSLSTFSAVVSSDREIAGAVESVALMTFGAAIALDQSVDAAVENILLATFPAAVHADTGIAGTLEALSLSTFPAGVSIGFNVASEQITLGTFIALISSDRSITGSVESLVLQANPASVTAGSSFAAGIEQLSLQTLPATVSLDIQISAQHQSLLLSSMSAQIGLARNLDANLESLTVTSSGATITLESGITAQLQALTLETFMADIVSAQTPIEGVGLAYTLADGKIHYTLPVDRLHFTFRS